MNAATDRIEAIQAALQGLVDETGRSLKRSAGAVAYFAEAQRMQLLAVVAADEPNKELAARRALGAVRLYAGVAAAEEGDEFDRRAVAILEVALRISGAAAAGVA